MHFNIRKAIEPDLDRIIDLATFMIPLSISPLRPADPELVKNYRRRDLLYLYDLIKKPNFGIFVAEDEEQNFLGHIIVGAQQIESSTGQEQGWLYDLSVKEKYWGQGVARELQMEAEKFIKSFGHKHIGLGVTLGNKRAVRFYEKMGYLVERNKMLKEL